MFEVEIKVQHQEETSAFLRRVLEAKREELKELQAFAKRVAGKLSLSEFENLEEQILSVEKQIDRIAVAF